MAESLDEKIRHRAYTLWEADGCPEGREMDYWLKAEHEIKSELVRTAAPKKAGKKTAARKPVTRKSATRKVAPKKTTSGKTART